MMKQMAGSQTLEAGLRAAADRVGAAPAFVDTSGVLVTHDDLRRVRDGGRQRLRDVGAGRADRVVVAMASGWEMAVCLLAVTSACTAAPLDPGLTDREVTDLLALLMPTVIVTDAESAPRLRSLAGADMPVLVWSVDRLDAVDDEEPDPSDVGLLLLTSGTTAAPKVAQLSHRNVAAGAESVGRTLRLDAADRAFNAMTLHHGHGIFPGTFAPLLTGGSTVCTRPASADELLTAVRSTSPTWYSAAPVVHHAILAMLRSSPLIAEALSPRLVRSASSSLSPQLQDQLEQALGVPVVQAYAISEAPGQVASNPLDGPRKPGTVGMPQDARIMLLDQHGELTGEPGGSGEVLVRGPNVFPGYLGVPDAEQPFLDGWLRTGDEASFDEDGYLVLSGRVADVINRGAEKITPAELDAVLAEHPAVREVAAFGRSHPTLGDEPAAAVVLHDGAATTEAELIAYAAQRLTSYKVPTSIHFMAALPRGATGKIVRRRLREMTARSGAGAGRRTAPTR